MKDYRGNTEGPIGGPGETMQESRRHTFLDTRRSAPPTILRLDLASSQGFGSLIGSNWRRLPEAVARPSKNGTKLLLEYQHMGPDPIVRTNDGDCLVGMRTSCPFGSHVSHFSMASIPGQVLTSVVAQLPPVQGIPAGQISPTSKLMSSVVTTIRELGRTRDGRARRPDSIPAPS